MIKGGVITNFQMVVGYENELAKVLEELVAEKEKRVKHEENEMKLQRDFKVRLLYYLPRMMGLLYKLPLRLCTDFRRISTRRLFEYYAYFFFLHLV